MAYVVDTMGALSPDGPGSSYPGRDYGPGSSRVATETAAAALVGVSGVLVALRYREGWSLGVGAISLMVAALLVHRPQVGP